MLQPRVGVGATGSATAASSRSGTPGSPRRPQSEAVAGGGPGGGSGPTTPLPVRQATWVCTICSFSNPVPAYFDPQTATVHTPLEPCASCGIKPTLTHVLKATIANAANRQQTPAAAAAALSSGIRSPAPLRSGTSQYVQAQRSLDLDASDVPHTSLPPASLPAAESTSVDGAGDGIVCPRCTFLNHSSLLSCEMCGAPLISDGVSHESLLQAQQPQRTDSPGPLLGYSTANGIDDATECVKIAFRGAGARQFYERLKTSLVQRKWLLLGAPPIPQVDRSGGGSDSGDAAAGTAGAGNPGGDLSTTTASRPRVVGIAGLEQMSVNARRDNARIIGSAFEDLEALMASAKEVAALAESFSRQVRIAGGANAAEISLLADSVRELGLVATKDIVGGSSGSAASESLYLSELSKTLAEHLTDDSRGILRKAGGVMSLVDLWARFNRARGGVELVSPTDFLRAAELWESLKLPVRLRTLRSGVKVVQRRDRDEGATLRLITAWLRDLHEFPPEVDVPWDWYRFGRGVTAQDAALRFGWSVTVALEELELAEEKGLLCREEGVEGLRFWENAIVDGAAHALS